MQFFITSPSLFATIFSRNKRKSRREYQNSERTLTLHLCLRIMGWTCLAIFSSIFFASSCPGFFRTLVSQTLWRSPKFIAEIENYPKALEDFEAKVTKAWVFLSLELWCSFVRWSVNPWETGKKFSDVGIGIWDLKLEGKWKRRLAGFEFMLSHTWEVDFSIFCKLHFSPLYFLLLN